MLITIPVERYRRFWRLYQMFIIGGGLLITTLCVSRAILLFPNFPPSTLIWGVSLLLLYIIGDLLPFSFRGTTLSISFIILLLTLLVINNTLGYAADSAVTAAVLGSTLGSSLSEGWRSFPRRHTTQHALGRATFYAAHHAIAAYAAGQAYLYATMQWSPWFALDSIHLQAVSSYLIVYTLLSSILIWPHDWLLNRFLLPRQEKPFPHLRLFITGLIVPVPVLLFVLFTLSNSLIWLLVFFLYLGFVYILRTYAEIDANGRQQKKLAELDKELGVPAKTDELLHKLATLLDQSTPYRWAALYQAANSSEDVFYLRGAIQTGIHHVVYQPLLLDEANEAVSAELVEESGKQLQTDRVAYWPRQINGNESKVNELLAHDLIVGVEGDGQKTIAKQSLFFPAFTAYMGLPIPFEDKKVGLLILTRQHDFFKISDWHLLQQLTTQVGSRLRHIEQVERSADHYLQQNIDTIQNMADAPARVQRSIEWLEAHGVEIAKVLNAITNHTMQNNVILVGNEESIFSEQTLEMIYQDVRLENPTMPSPTKEIIAALKVIPDYYSLAYSLKATLKDINHDGDQHLHDFLAKAAKVQTIEAITDLQHEIEDLIEDDKKPASRNLSITLHLRRLLAIIKLLKDSNFTGTEQKQENLAHVLQEIKNLDGKIQLTLSNPERYAFQLALVFWRSAVTQALNKNETGGAELKIELRQTYARITPTITISLGVENSGMGVALDCDARLKPSGQYEVIEAQPLSDILLPGQQQEIIFELRLLATGIEQVRLEFDLTYKDRENQLSRSLNFADILYLRPTPPPFTDIQNPYLAGIPLNKDHPSFFGRDDMFDFVRDNMRATSSHRPVLLLIGIRRIGKTSILKQLPARLKDDSYLHIFIDCQALVDAGTANFFLFLATAISDGLEEAGYKVDPPTYAELEQQPGHQFEYIFLPRVWGAIGQRRLLLAIDEYDTLEARVKAGRLDKEVIAYLRSLMQHQPRLSFIFAGTFTLQELTGEYWHVLFNVAKIKKVGFLPETDARRIIIQPVQAMVYDDLAVDELLRGTGCHPYFLQLACDHLVTLCNRERRNYVTIRHAQDALREILDLGDSHLNFIWSGSTPVEQRVVSALAKSLLFDRHPTVDTLVRYLEKAKHDDKRPEVRAALEKLEQRAIVARREEPNQQPTYAFTVGLYEMWVKKRHALD